MHARMPNTSDIAVRIDIFPLTETGFCIAHCYQFSVPPIDMHKYGNYIYIYIYIYIFFFFFFFFF